jgi:ketosteroid isomerase-like protein
MRLSLRLALSLALVATLFKVTKADDQAEIKALEDRQFAAFRARDIDAYMACFVPGDSLFIFDGFGPPREYVGAKAWRKSISDVFASSSGPIEANYSDLSVVTEGSMAFAHYIDHQSFMWNGKKWNLTERWTDVFRKIKGKWLIIHEHTSFPYNGATGTADLSSKP